MPVGYDKYPKDKVAKGDYSHGGVKQGNKPVSNAGKEQTKTGRAGK